LISADSFGSDTYNYAALRHRYDAAIAATAKQLLALLPTATLVIDDKSAIAQQP
tara:strand:+ start:79 stop:240 length:162 start_codon:yes stop_codon:yes gene_type:complete